MRKLSIAEALREAIREEMRADERVFLIGEDIGIPQGFGGAFGVYLGLAEEFGRERVIDTPISEKAIVGAAIGAALMGLRPIADVQYSDFLFCAMDEIVNQAPTLRYLSAGKLSVPMVLRAPVGATTRGPQHAQSPECFFLNVPGWKVALPSTAYDAKGLLKTAIRDENPVLFFEHKLLYGSKGREQAGGFDLTSEVPEEEYFVPFGQAAVRRKGEDVTVVATFLMLYKVLAVAEELASQGISLEVIDPQTLIPLDKETILESIAKTGRLVIVEEGRSRGGIGAEIAAIVAEEALYYLESPIKRIAAYDVPIPFAPVLESYVIPSEERIKKGIMELLG